MIKHPLIVNVFMQKRFIIGVLWLLVMMIKSKNHIVPGGHTKMNCKQYLVTTLEEIYK